MLFRSARSPPCPSKEVAEHVTIQKIRESGPRVRDESKPEIVHDLVFTNNRPTTIVVSCPGREESYVLPLATWVRVTRTCSIKMINPPDVFSHIPGLEIAIIEDKHVEVKSTGDQTVETLDFIREHISGHAYIYITAWTVGTSMLFVFSLCACVHECQRHREFITREPRNYEQSELEPLAPQIVIPSPPERQLVVYGDVLKSSISRVTTRIVRNRHQWFSSGIIRVSKLSSFPKLPHGNGLSIVTGFHHVLTEIVMRVSQWSTTLQTMENVSRTDVITTYNQQAIEKDKAIGKLRQFPKVNIEGNIGAGKSTVLAALDLHDSWD